MRRSTAALYHTLSYRKATAIKGGEAGSMQLNDYNKTVAGINLYQPANILVPVNSVAIENCNAIAANGNGYFVTQVPEANFTDALFDTGIRLEGYFDIIMACEVLSFAGTGNYIKIAMATSNFITYTFFKLTLLGTSPSIGIGTTWRVRGSDVLGTSGGGTFKWIRLAKTSSGMGVAYSNDRVNWGSYSAETTSMYAPKLHLLFSLTQTTTDYTLWKLGGFDVRRGIAYYEY